MLWLFYWHLPVEVSRLDESNECWVMKALLTVLVGRGNPDGPPCKLLRPDSDTLELDSRFRFELDAGGELILGRSERGCIHLRFAQLRRFQVRISR